MYCTKCGVPASPEDAFCGNCGAQLQCDNPANDTSPMDTSVTCPKCFTIYSAKFGFCPHCTPKSWQITDASSTSQKKRSVRKPLIIALASVMAIFLLAFLFLRNRLIETDSHYDDDIGRYVKDYRYFGSLESLLENERDLIVKLAATGGECECNDYTIGGLGWGAVDLLDYDYVIYSDYHYIATKDTDHFNRFPNCNEFDIHIYPVDYYGSSPAYLYEDYLDVYSFYDYFD